MEDLWTLDGLLVDKNDDGIPDGVSLYIDLPENLYPIGLFDFLARAGLETTALSFNFFEKHNQKVTLTFEKSNHSEITFESEILSIYYQSEEDLSNQLRHISQLGLKMSDSEESKERPMIRGVSDIWTLAGFGQYQEASPIHPLSVNIDSKLDWNKSLFLAVCQLVARLGLVSTTIKFPLTNNEMADIQFVIEENGQSSIKVLEENIIKVNGSKEECAQLIDWLSNEKAWKEDGVLGSWERPFLYAHLTNENVILIEENWQDQSEVDIAEEHIKMLSEEEKENVVIYLSEPLSNRTCLKEKWEKNYGIQNLVVRSSFKPAFHWLKEEIIEKIPQNTKQVVIKVKEHDVEGSLELPIRWIQEIYPIDLIIEKATSIHSDNVIFELNKDQQHTYEVFAVLNNEECVFIDYLDVVYSKVPYVDGEKFATPTTSCIVCGEEQNKVITIPTDRERFYNYYLEAFLPKLVETIGDIKDGMGYTEPLFSGLQVEVWMSEEEEKLGVDEERTSSLEALYEDIYFNTLDYFDHLGNKQAGKPYTALGAVIPVMHVEQGTKPRANVKVTKWNNHRKKEVQTKELFFNDGKPSKVQIAVNNETSMYDVDELQLEWEKIKKAESNIGENLFIDYSFRGLPIDSIEKYLPTGEQFESPIKMTLFKPTVLIEAMHHPNEVSSNPAVLKLLEELDSNTNLLKQLNVVTIPMANPDGYSLLMRLTKEHPEWKHHAARYNSLGFEYAHTRYLDTIFGESNVLPELMKRWAPDVVVDNHGIPGHEWIQPFAGYNSPPRFPVSYFIPSAKIYGLGRYSFDTQTELARNNLDKIVSDMNEIYRSTNIPKQNEYWRNRFTKYGHQWLPNVFPLEVHGNINFYKSIEVTPTYSSVSILRYPNWVAADIISEAADEVVYGDVLEECIDAQYLFNLSIVQTVAKTKVKVNRNGNTIYRERPLRI